MKLSLRKAHALETALNNAAKEAMAVTGNFQFSIFGDNLEERIAQEKEKFKKSQSNATRLINAAFEVRSILSEANQKAGINSLLQQKAHKERLRSLFMFKIATPETSVSEIKRRIDLSLKSHEDRYGRNSETVYVWIISDEDRETAKKEHTKLEKELVSINDKLLGKNLAETVDIPESVAKIAEEFELI